MSAVVPPKQITVPEFRAAKARGAKLAVVTAYDYTSARLTDEAGVDAILVGDSLGMVVLGHQTTLPVTLDDMIHHARAVGDLAVTSMGCRRSARTPSTRCLVVIGERLGHADTAV